jgi:hypothetical protein
LFVLLIFRRNICGVRRIFGNSVGPPIFQKIFRGTQSGEFYILPGGSRGQEAIGKGQEGRSRFEFFSANEFYLDFGDSRFLGNFLGFN